MRVQEEVLSPGMQNSGDTDLRSQVLGIGRHLDQGLCAGLEQQIVEQPLVVHGQHVEFVRDAEHNVKVAGGEKFSFSRRQPALARLCLALGTVPVSARVIGDGRLVSASRTGIHVSSQRGRAAALNRPECLELLKVEALVVPVQEAVALRAENVGHLHGGAAHFCRGR